MIGDNFDVIETKCKCLSHVIVLEVLQRRKEILKMLKLFDSYWFVFETPQAFHWLATKIMWRS